MTSSNILASFTENSFGLDALALSICIPPSFLQIEHSCKQKGSVPTSVEIAVADFQEVESAFERANADVAKGNAADSILEFSAYTAQIAPFARDSEFPPKCATLPKSIYLYPGTDVIYFRCSDVPYPTFGYPYSHRRQPPVNIPDYYRTDDLCTLMSRNFLCNPVTVHLLLKAGARLVHAAELLNNIQTFKINTDAYLSTEFSPL